MEQIAALMLLIGCSDDLSACRELPAPEPAYENVAACEAGIPAAMSRHASDHPQLLAQCFAVDTETMHSDAEIVWSINPAGELIASVEATGSGDLVVASRQIGGADTQDAQ